MTIHEIIEKIKLKGEVLEHSILSLPNDKYSERAIILFETKYYVTCSILDNYVSRCYYEDMEAYNSEQQARTKYDNLLNEHNGTVYE